MNIKQISLFYMVITQIASNHMYIQLHCVNISKALYVLDYEIIMCNNAHYLPLERWNDCKEDSRFHVQLLPPAV